MRAPTSDGLLDNDIDNVELLADPRTGSALSETPQVEEVLWEDEPEYNLAYPKEASPAPALTQRFSRKRKPPGKKIFLAQPSPSPRKLTSTKGKGNIQDDLPPLINIDNARVRRGIHDGAAFTWDYLFDVFSTALHLLRKPLAGLLFFYILALILTQISSAFRTAFAPICWLPGISRTPLCYTALPAPKVPKWADYPKLVDVESVTFEKLLDESVGSAGLSLDIKKAEMATNDLVTLVKVSNLKSRDRLAEHLEAFVDDSKKTGRALQRLSSRVSGAVDSITAVNEHALQTIQEAQAAKASLSLTGLILWPISKGVATKVIVAETFADAMSVLETQISRIRLEAEATAILLNNLEQSLITLHELLTRENITLSHEKEELLAELWTKLGGNRKKLRGVNNHMWLMQRVGDWRMRAQVHVVATLQALDSMSEDMEDLRERVAKPELIGEGVPPEVHMKSIQAGLDRLKVDRKRAKEREEENLRRALSIDGSHDD
ncbi:hypothetical protein BC835DRAFT_1270949 [Cytidiella melzeri]|nr:hypothetical protein BC835DRAFT_1270949 [Cytidiella melzeri]